MGMIQYDIGDLIFAAEDLRNDGGMPGFSDEALIAATGTRGVVVQYGHAEADPEQEVYLVRFETGPDGTLGAPVGCLPGELTQTPPG